MGIYYQDQLQEWQLVNQQSHALQDNFCYSVLSLPNDILLCGHNSVGITAIYIGEGGISAITDNIEVASTMNYYPNPFVSGHLTFSSSHAATGEVELTIFDLTGKISYRSKKTLIDQNEFRFSVDDKLPSGVYLINLTGAFQGVPGLLYVD